MTALTHDEIRRYSRHLILPEVALAGQEKLKAASVLLVGAGGLGSPAAMYLAAAGVGRLGIVDDDVVEESNLQRQVIHGQRALGTPKVDSAAQRLNDINPHVEIESHQTRLSSINAMELLRGYDVIADGTDNFPTRYLINDACVMLNKPNVYASVFRFEGQLSVFATDSGPCYRCLYPQPPPPELVPSCAEGGVLGILPGIMGLLQATEVIKQLLGLGETMVGRLLLFDALSMRFRELGLAKATDCVICSETPSITELIDYEKFCGVIPAEEIGAEVTPRELQRRMSDDNESSWDLIDVREPHEWQIGKIEGARLIPLAELPARMSELNSSRRIILYCRMGDRSRRAMRLLRDAGFARLENLEGGINAWSRDVDPSVPQY